MKQHPIGRMLRPRKVVVASSALVPEQNYVRPSPNHFTHEVRDRQPYYYGAKAGPRADGEFLPGAKVVLMVYRGGQMCRVIDSRGLYVLTRYSGLRAPSKQR